MTYQAASPCKDTRGKDTVSFITKYLLAHIHIHIQNEMAVPVPLGTVILSDKSAPPSDDEKNKMREIAKRDLKTDPMYWKRVKVSALAAIKILTHAMTGVKEGREDPERGTPIEVMGCLLGYVDPEDKQCVIVTDSFILPCKGGAHSAEEDARTAPYEAEYVGAVVEKTQKRISKVGWYHSHPFDPVKGGNGCALHHCWYSTTDVKTQTQHQVMMDRFGVPFVGIVVDPLTTIKTRKMHLGCYRIYNRMNEKICVPCRTPDGKGLDIFGKDANTERWGEGWKLYYALDVTFFTNPQNRKMFSILNAAYGWVNDIVGVMAGDERSASVRLLKKVTRSPL